MKRLVLTLPVLALASLLAPISRAQSPAGAWVGAISVMGQELNIMVTFKQEADSLSATIDIPQQMALGLPLRNVAWRPPNIHFELPAGPGLAVFDGTIRGDSVSGNFMQAGISGTFRLERGKDVRTMPPAPPEVPPPYREEEVTINAGEVKLAGTLTLPPGKGRHPAVVLITGSGAHNRDEELPGFKPFRILADHLTRKGCAVLRCDDRGVGGSTGSKSSSTSADHASDMIREVEFLKARPDINPHQIGLCGHSEGGLIAPIAAAASHDVAFIVLLAGPAVKGDRLILFQLESHLRSTGAGDEQVRAALEKQNRVFECVRTGKGWDALEEEFKQENAAGRLAPAKTPWFRYFVTFDPVPALEQIPCPVLAVFGALDMQVPVSLNREPMEKALSHSRTKDWKIEIIPKANHLFQEAKTGLPGEYASLEYRFIPGFLDLVSGWITKRVTVLRGPSGGREN